MPEPYLLVMSGDVDYTATQRFRAEGLGRLGQVRVVDLSAVTFVDSSAIALLLECLRRGMRTDPLRRLQVVGASDHVQSLLGLMGLSGLLDLEPTTH